MVEGENRQTSAEGSYHGGTLYSVHRDGSPSDDTPSADAAGVPSSSPPVDDLGKHEMSSFVLPAKKDSAVMSFVEHSMAEWEKIFSPDEPDNQAVALFMAGLHGDDLSAHVSNELAKNYRKGCMRAYDFSLLDEFDEEDNIHLTYTSDVFVGDHTMKAALSNDGKRMMIYSIK